MLNNLRVWMMSRRLDPVGILMIGSIASGTVASLVAGNIFYKIITDCILNSAWGLAFLGSLFFRRPLIFFIIRQLVAGEDASRTEIWNGLWRYAAFRLTMRSITATWAAVYFAELLIEVAFARILSPETVATFSPLMGVVATLALIVFTRQRMRSARTRIELDEHLKWPL